MKNQKKILEIFKDMKIAIITKLFFCDVYIREIFLLFEIYLSIFY
jgi:hypothetical protein